jgi:hypothetical protein
MDAILLLLDQREFRPDRAEEGGERGQAASEQAMTAFDLIGYLTPWAFASGRRLILAADVPMAVMASMSLTGMAPPPPVEMPERPPAPILFMELWPRGEGEAIPDDDRALAELHEIGLLDFEARGRAGGPSGLSMILRQHRPSLLVAATRDRELWSVVANYQGEAGASVECISALAGEPVAPFGVDLLRPDENQVQALALLAGDSDELASEEIAARREAAVLVDLLRRLQAPLATSLRRKPA